MVYRKLSSMQRTLCMFYVCLSASILPVTSDTTYSFRLQEELPADTFVGTINVQQGQISGNSDQFFSVSRSGDITTTLPVDRESLSSNPIVFDVRSSSSAVTVRIHVDDINDNIPEFPSPVLPLRIFENDQVNSEYSIDLATDADAAENGTVDYAIISGNEDGKFRLGRNATECSTNGFSLCIVTEGSLDRENVSFYRLNISASDRGKPSQRSFCLVNITIVDLNDNSPVFSKSIYSVSVNENNPVGVQILAVTATDKDQGVNGKIEYSFQNDPGSSKFQVNTSSGVISARTPLDYDVQGQKSYSFKVYARDRPGKPDFRQATADVVVNILDVNDNIPQLQVFYSQGKSPAEVSENAVIGTVIATVLINDGDDSSGPNGQVYVEIANGNGTFELVYITMTPTGRFIYQLKTATSLDRERIAFHNITITARDGGSPSLNSTVNVLLSVKDVNDEVPTFSKPRYTASVSEQAQNGSSVLRVVAHDSDTGSNAQISYSIISGNELHWFGIDSASGLITTENSIDRESVPQVTLTERAQSNSNPGNLTQITATDADEGSNGQIIYSIIKGDEGKFDIDGSSGVIRTLASLDSMVKGFYKLIIAAQDMGGKFAQQNASVEVTVQGQLDNPPQFEYAVYNFSVYENVAQRTYIGRVVATSKDNNASMRYTIVSGDPGQLFSVDSVEGIIMVHGKLDRETKDKYSLNVIAQVGYVRPLSGTTTVFIEILDSNDNSPQFSPTSAAVTIDASWPAGKQIYVATAFDKDAGLNGIVHYQLTDDGNGLCKVNTTSGAIFLARRVTSIDDSQLVLSMLASDLGSPPLYAVFMLRVVIVSNNPPRFLASSFTVNISRDVPIGKQILPVTALDPDSGTNGMVAYAIAPTGNEEGLFGISKKGILLVNKNLDLASVLHSLTVTATDKGETPLTSSTSVTVRIQDSISYQAIFKNQTFVFSVMENQLPGSIVCRLIPISSDSSRRDK
ncbi:PREDICTED: protocadherin Fat 4-like, partial [Acropora digitifera]|uniref:protocadherin Fat 4-like n=1 Tax=Acropora digitifera TaxID=70779 RepID=UPI00077A6987